LVRTLTFVGAKIFVIFLIIPPPVCYETYMAVSPYKLIIYNVSKIHFLVIGSHEIIDGNNLYVNNYLQKIRFVLNFLPMLELSPTLENIANCLTRYRTISIFFWFHIIIILLCYFCTNKNKHTSRK